MSDVPYDGWWRAANGRWYPPEMRPGLGADGPQVPPPGWFVDATGDWRPPQARERREADDGPPGEPDGDGRSRWHRALLWALAVLCFALGGLVGFALFDRDDAPPPDPDTEIGPALPPVTLDATTSSVP